MTSSPHIRIWRIAGPAILANCSTALIGLVDTWAIGHLPDPALLAAIGIAGFIFNYLMWGLGFLRMGTTGAAAQAKGRDDEAGLRALVLRGGLIALGLAAVLLILRDLILSGALLFLQPESALQAPIAAYYDVRIWSLPAVLIKLVAVGAFIGLGRTGTALGIEVVANLINAAMTILFVQGLGWGIGGAALASLLAEQLAALLALILIARSLGGSALIAQARARHFWDRTAFATLLSGNLFLLLRTLFLLSAFALMWRQGVALGTDIAAANQVLLQFLTLAALGLDGMAYAAEAEVGQAVGRRDRVGFRRMSLLTSYWACALAMGLSLIYWLAGDAIIRAFTVHTQVRQLAGQQALIMAALPIVAVWSYQLDGIYVGATAHRAMVGTMCVAFVGFLLTSVWWVPRFGNDGLWAAMLFFLGLRGLSQAIFYPMVERRAIAQCEGT